MTYGHQLGLRLFLEGVEVPVIGANISIVPNAPVAAQIQVIGTDRLLSILPRTIVHLFFYDYVDASNPVSEEDAKMSGLSPSDQELSKYRLLFMGEVQGISFQKSSAERAAILNCVDFSNYWDTTYQYNFGGSLFGGHRQAAFIGANTNLLTSPLGHGVGLFARLLSSKSVNFPDMKGLLAGVVRCLEAIGGCYYGQTTFRGANDFTSMAELRLKILQQITAAEADNSTAKLFARKSFNMWLNQQMQGLGKLVTFRGVVDILNRFIFHEIYPNPCAMYVPEQQQQKTQAYYVNIATDPRYRSLFNAYRKLIRVLNSAAGYLQPPPASIAAPGNSVTFGYVSAGSDLAQAWRIMRSQIVGESVKLKGAGAHGEVLSSSVYQHLQAARKLLGSGDGFGSSVDQAKAANASIRKQAVGEIDAAINAIKAALGQKTKKSKQVTYTKRSRLNNQVLRPDIWFVSPPRCNVLFPEQYENFQWERNFLREVSRLELQTTHEILDVHALFNGRYYAPNVADMRKGVKLSSRAFGQMTLEHELYTGIIPMYEKLSEANLFAMRSKQVNVGGAKVGYAQRAVNFQYFKHRFASRQMSATGRFNPWFVAGFPSLLIDKPMDAVNLAISGLPVEDQLKVLDLQPDDKSEITRAVLLQKLVPVQYMGMAAQVQHMLNQQGGRSMYAFTQARVHREDTELLGVDKASASKRIGTGSRTYIASVAYNKLPKKGSRGKYGGQITALSNVSSSNMGRFIPGLFDKRKYLGYGEGSLANQQLAPEYYPINGTTVLAYKITESFVRRARVKINLPIEEAIRPPWVWNGWTNLRIGETYLQFFGTNSITDIEAFTASGTAAINAIGSGLSGDYGMVIESSEGLAQSSGVNPQTAPQTPSTPFSGAAPNYGSPTAGMGDFQANQRPPGGSLTSYDQKISAATILTIEKERTIENAVDYLVRLYSYIKANSLDVGQFLRNYTWRPVATLVEILGSSDFRIDPDPNNPDNYITSGVEGFHSRSFSDESNLYGLVDPQVTSVLGLKKPPPGKPDKRNAAVERLDVRGKRRQLIREYVNELTNSRGLLG